MTATAMTVGKQATGEKVRQGTMGFGEPPEIEKLWVDYKETRDPLLRNKLIERYYPLVRYIGERLLSTLPRSIELDDLTSAGFFGLMDAIDGFDLTRGIKFKTYCTTRVRGSILDELRSQDWVPRLVRLKANKISRAWKTLEARFGREPTEVEMAELLEISVDEFNPRREGIVERIDENEDGVVTLDEINQHIAYREAEMAEKIAEMRQRIQQHFDDADTDANGMVTEYEARSAAFNRIDEDGNGYLTEDELRTADRHDMKRHRRHRGGPDGV